MGWDWEPLFDKLPPHPFHLRPFCAMSSSPDGIRSNTITPTEVRSYSPTFPKMSRGIHGLSSGVGGARSAAIAAAPNPYRIEAEIENLSNANVLYVKLGPGCTSTDYHKILAVASGAGAGNGEAWKIPAGYIGEISTAGTSPSYSYVESTQ